MIKREFYTSRYPIILGVALFLSVTANTTFLNKILALYPLSDNVGFITALFILLFGILVLVISLLSLVIPVRLVGAVLIVGAALSAFVVNSFGTVIDKEMWRNIVETNISEALDLLTPPLVVHVFYFALLPVVILFWLPFEKESVIRRITRSGILASVALVVCTLCILSNGSQFASFFREHKPIRFYVNPLFPMVSGVSFAKHAFMDQESHEFLSLNAQLSKEQPFSNEKPKLVVLVIGESARADHFSLDGYQRNTNEFTEQKQRLISYSAISSCGTSTAVSVPCMLSYSGRNGFNVDVGRRTENILDLLQRAGVNVLWRDNNSDSKGMATRVAYEDFRTAGTNKHCDIECRDIGLLDGLRSYASQHPGDILLVLHQMGSHGPAYFKRYPAQFAKYKPACNSLELAECTRQEIINAYDNSIRYTDYFLAKVIEFLEAQSAYETTMLYVSDHGESLGESGIYLHGLPYVLAPQAQTHVPVLLWTGKNSEINLEASRKLEKSANSHDAIFDLLLTLFDVKTSLSPASKQPLVILKANTTMKIGKL